ncbi:Ubiquitin-like-specific protease 1 [Colletotrichum sp. SAR 10_66]|nr:Ubiquitin-like-specific protease 1 [Colletotrichum sp. SAR 10_66]
MARLSRVHMSAKPLVPISPDRPTPPPKAAPRADLVATSAKAARSNLRSLMEAVADTWDISPAEMIAHFGQTTSEKFFKELKGLASAYSFDLASPVLKKVHSERRSGKVSTQGVSRRADWLPSDVVRARDILRQQDEDRKTNVDESLAAYPDPELPRRFQTLHHTTPKLRGFDPQLSAATFRDDSVAFEFNEKDLEKEIDASRPPSKHQLLDSQGLKGDPTCAALPANNHLTNYAEKEAASLESTRDNLGDTFGHGLGDDSGNNPKNELTPPDDDDHPPFPGSVTTPKAQLSDSDTLFTVTRSVYGAGNNQKLPRNTSSHAPRSEDVDLRLKLHPDIDHKTVKSTPHPSSSKPIEATTDFLSFPNGTPRQNIATTVKIRSDTPKNGLGSLQQTSDIFDSLAPGRRLESQAVDACIRLLTGATNSHSFSRLVSTCAADHEKHACQVGHGQKIIFPVHLPEVHHWVLLVIEKGNICVDVFDPAHMTSTGRSDVTDLVETLGKTCLLQGINDKPQLRYKQTILQRDGVDSGVIALVNAAHLVAGKEPSPIIDVTLWRMLFGSFAEYAGDDNKHPWGLHATLDNLVVDLDDQDPLPNAARITPDDIGRAKARFARWTAKAKTSLQHVCAENIDKLEAYAKHINDAKEVILGAQHYRGPKFHAELTRLETVAHAREKIFQGFLELPDPSPEDIIQSERAKLTFEEDRHRFQGFAESRRGLRSAELALQLESDDVARRIEALRESSKRLEDE